MMTTTTCPDCHGTLRVTYLHGDQERTRECHDCVGGEVVDWGDEEIEIEDEANRLVTFVAVGDGPYEMVAEPLAFARAS